MSIIAEIAALAAAGSNPVTAMLQGAKIASAALPSILAAGGNIVAHEADIAAKFAALEAGLARACADAKRLDITSAEADLGAAWKAGMAVYADVGLPREAVQTVIAAATADNGTPAFVKAAVAAGETLARQLGLAPA